MLQLGIIGTGRIARRFVPEAAAVPGVKIRIVYNPRLESARRFSEELHISAFTDDLEELVDQVEAVYIASPHETHYEYAKRMLSEHIHVLCEKPMVLTEMEAEELFELAGQTGCVLMEAVKTAYCPGFEKLLEVAVGGTIGTIRYVNACFTKLELKNSRELSDHIYGGSFTELGSYCLLPVIKLFGSGYEQVCFDSIKGDYGLDVFTRMSIRYPKGFADAVCGLGVKAEGRLMIAGTRGYIVAEAPWWKTTYFEVHYEDPQEVEKYSESFLGDGLRYEISDFLNMVNGGGNSGFKLTRGDSIAMAGIMEQFMKEEDRKIEDMGA